MPRDDNYKVTPAPPGIVRLTVYDAPDYTESYRVAPGSRHRVSITDLAAPPLVATASNKKSTTKKSPILAPQQPVPVVRVLTADAQGRLAIEARGATLLIDVEPVA
jgi:hypothetical protein